MTEFVLEKEKFNGKNIFVLYERKEGTVDVAIYEHPNPIQARKYQRKLEMTPGIKRSTKRRRR